MTRTLDALLKQALAGTPLEPRLEMAAAPLLERRGKDACVSDLDGPALRGLARLVGSNPEAARYLSMRPALLEEIAQLGPDTLARRELEVGSREAPGDGENLEDFLDALRHMRRDETLLAACCQLGGLAEFDRVSVYLSIVAETCVRWALQTAEGERARSGLSVLGMGKIAGREFTYHSDLDVIFLFADEVDDVVLPSRTGQRLISYLTTMTVAGVAYAVDSRLRPSGGQGALVSTYSAYERYQTTRAALWEHLALMRARAIAGDLDAAQQVLERTRASVLREPRSPWEEVAAMRHRVESERAGKSNNRFDIKTGSGGLMDVEFLATGALLECGLQLAGARLPSIPAMLRAVVPAEADQDTARPIETLLEGYAYLRCVEACARWISGRPVEWFGASGEQVALIAELVEPGLSASGLGERIQRVCRANRKAFDAVVERGTIRALAG